MIAARATVMTVLLLALSGCGGLLGLGEATRALDAYELRAPADMPQAGRSLARSLIVEPPSSGGGLATDRIMIRPTPLQAFYLPRARWTEEAPVMLQTVMVRSFEDTNALRHVGRRALPGGFADFTLVSDLTDFQAEILEDGSTQVRVRLTARLVRDDDGQVVGTRSFQAVVPVSSEEALPLVEGFNAATDTIMRELSAWALGRMGVRLSG